MPHRLTWDDAGLLQIDVSGELRSWGLAAFAIKVRRWEARRSPTPSRLVDLSAVTAFHVRYDVIAALAAMRRALRFRDAFKSAIVAPQPAQYGFARMFQTLNQHPQITIRIFRDRAEALRWLRG